ncbi:hypothetical protein BZL41_01460 [Pseudomonas sp. PIC25]|uniref:hypothetical protein n=1 Tax=Pseudomonas sp. PIC25 TaxID=1958773 RepID=UPI000BABA3B6|nr:hypothetical protein [Pseudomonas sp. PIC25]PAU66449.1 hypothetical protein BZL41_01460 [Pseudomonas sp. PIC25]
MYRRSTRVRFFAWLLVCLASLSLPVFAESTPLTQIQVHACRATGSLLLLRGEGFQESHAARLENDIRALDEAMRGLPQASAELRQHQLQLVAQLRRGVAFGPGDENMPWRYPQELAKSLRDFLTAARAEPGANPQDELPAKLEYLAVQYLSRSYIGTFEIAREQPDTYLGQDERQLVPALDNELAALDTKANPKAVKLQTRWKYLRAALMDMNSQSNALVSASGRPFAPTTVDRNARSLSTQLMALNPGS